MSSMRNAVQRRPHRERAQPLERQRLGILEKHKDYSLRAKDYNKKKAQLKSLRQKAAERNEDEFYYGMLSRKGPGSRIQDGRSWKGTVQGDRGNKGMDVDAVRLLKTQDLGYVRTMKQMASKEVSKLEERVVLTRGLDHLDDAEGDEDHNEDSDDDFEFNVPLQPSAPRKIVFMEDKNELDAAVESRMAQDEDNDDEVDDNDGDRKTDDQAAERGKLLRRLKKQLEHARKKLRVLSEAESELEIQKAKMAKTATSGGYTRKGDKIKVRTRKR